jgi:predicted Rdx family selenoprotein
MGVCGVEEEGILERLSCSWLLCSWLFGDFIKILLSQMKGSPLYPNTVGSFELLTI